MIRLKKTTLRILDILSRDVNNSISINELKRRIREIYGTAYYKNIYNEVQTLRGKDLLKISKRGGSSLIRLNFDTTRLVDFLAGMELEKKERFLETRPELNVFFSTLLTTYFNEKNNIQAISVIKPEKNAKLNRQELVFLLTNASASMHDDVLLKNKELESKFNLKLDPLLLTKEEFWDLLASKEENPVKAMFWNKTVFFCPHMFWMIMQRAITQGKRIETKRKGTDPADISRKNLLYNLYRFGYTERGASIEEGKKRSIESIITALLIGDDARKMQAIPILLAKNQVNYDLLIFLSKKYKTSETLLGLIKTLGKVKKTTRVKDAIHTLELMGTKAKSVDEKSIIQKMRGYDAL